MKKIGNIAFYIAIVLEIIVMMTDHFSSFTLPYRGRVTHVAFALFLIKIICSKYSIKHYLIIGIGMLLGAISYFTCDDEYVLRCVALLAASIDIEIERILKWILYSALAGSIVIVICSLFGICGDLAVTRDFGRGIVETRYCLGFNHANNVHDMLWYILTLILVLYRDKFSWKIGLSASLFNVGIYCLTLSRTGAIVVQLIIIGLLLVHYVHKKWIEYSVIISTFISVGSIIFLSIYSSIFNICQSKLVRVVDHILNGRLEMVAENAQSCYWEMFPGPRIAEKVDNGFVSFLYSYGTVICLIFVIALVYALIKCILKKEYYMLILLIGSILVTFMEATFIFNVSILCNINLILLIYLNLENEKHSRRSN